MKLRAQRKLLQAVKLAKVAKAAPVAAKAAPAKPKKEKKEKVKKARPAGLSSEFEIAPKAKPSHQLVGQFPRQFFSPHCSIVHVSIHRWSKRWLGDHNLVYCRHCGLVLQCYFPSILYRKEPRTIYLFHEIHSR